MQWRYATWGERCGTAGGAALAWLGSCGLVCAVLIYGELTALFVARHRAAPAPASTRLLRLFGGGDFL